MNKLLPCPFCNCKMKLKTWNYLGNKYAVGPVKKHKPWCCLNRASLRSYDDPDNAIEAWNTREGKDDG